MKKRLMYIFVTCIMIGVCFGCGKRGQNETENKTAAATETVAVETKTEINAETDDNAEMQSEQIETGGEDSWEDSAEGWD